MVRECDILMMTMWYNKVSCGRNKLQLSFTFSSIFQSTGHGHLDTCGLHALLTHHSLPSPPLPSPFQSDPVPDTYADHTPDHRIIYKFVKTLFTSAQLTAECAIISLVSGAGALGGPELPPPTAIARLVAYISFM